MKSVEEFEHRERESEPQILNFFELTTEEMQRLREKIERSDGLVRVFVHPDFAEYASFKSTGQEDKKVLEEKQTAFDKIISSRSEDVPALFLFVSGQDAEDFNRKMDPLYEKANNDLYIIRTEAYNPNPLPTDQYKTYTSLSRIKVFREPSDADKIRKETEAMWDTVKDVFKSIGVKKILIGGEELYVSPKAGEPHGGCLGKTINELGGSFNVEVSSLTWPEGRKEIRKQED